MEPWRVSENQQRYRDGEEEIRRRCPAVKELDKHGQKVGVAMDIANRPSRNDNPHACATVSITGINARFIRTSRHLDVEMYIILYGIMFILWDYYVCYLNLVQTFSS